MDLFSFSAGKQRVILLGGREDVNEGDNEGLREDVREGKILILPLKLLDFGGERLPRIFNARTHAHTHAHKRTHMPVVASTTTREGSTSIAAATTAATYACRAASTEHRRHPPFCHFLAVYGVSRQPYLSPHFFHFLESYASYVPVCHTVDGT